MSLTNAKITAEIETISEKFKCLLETMNESLQKNNQAFIEPSKVIDCLLFSPNDPRTNIPKPLTLAQLNLNYQSFITTNQLPLSTPLIKELSDQDDNRTLASNIQIHFLALASGFKEVYKASKTSEVNARITRLLEAMNHTQMVNKQPLIEAGPFIKLLSDTGQTPLTGQTNTLSFASLDSNYAMLVNAQNFNLPISLIETSLLPADVESIMPGIMSHFDALAAPSLLNKHVTEPSYDLMLSLLEKTAATLLYPIGQTYLRMEELINGENLVANTAVLSIGAVAAWLRAWRHHRCFLPCESTVRRNLHRHACCKHRPGCLKVG